VASTVASVPTANTTSGPTTELARNRCKASIGMIDGGVVILGIVLSRAGASSVVAKRLRYNLRERRRIVQHTETAAGK